MSQKVHSTHASTVVRIPCWIHIHTSNEFEGKQSISIVYLNLLLKRNRELSETVTCFVMRSNLYYGVLSKSTSFENTRLKIEPENTIGVIALLIIYQMFPKVDKLHGGVYFETATLRCLPVITFYLLNWKIWLCSWNRLNTSTKDTGKLKLATIGIKIDLLESRYV